MELIDKAQEQPTRPNDHVQTNMKLLDQSKSVESLSKYIKENTNLPDMPNDQPELEK